MTQRHQGVHRLPRLGDSDHQDIRADDRIAVTEFTGQFDFHRDTRPVLDRILCDHAGVRCGATGDDHDLVDALQIGIRHAHLIQLQSAFLVDPTTQRISDGLRLFGDFLEHEQIEAALFRRGRIPVDGERGDLRGLTIEGGHLHAICRERHHLVLTQFQGLLGVCDEGRDIGCQEVLTVAKSDDQW